MERLLQERAKRSRGLELEVMKQMPYKEEFDNEVQEWRDRHTGKFNEGQNEAMEKLYRRLFDVLGGKIHQLETYLDKEHAVLGWAQIPSSLEAAIVLFLNANIATKSYKIGSLELLEGVLSRAEDENKQMYEKITTFINTIESMLGVSLSSLLSLMLSLNRLKRNPAAHRSFSTEDVKEATTIRVAIDSNDLTPANPRLYVSHVMKNPHNRPFLEEPEQRATLERITTVYMNALDRMRSFCYYFGLDSQKFEDEYDVVKDRDLKIVQTKLLAYWIDCQLRNKGFVR